MQRDVSKLWSAAPWHITMVSQWCGREAPKWGCVNLTRIHDSPYDETRNERMTESSLWSRGLSRVTSPGVGHEARTHDSALTRTWQIAGPRPNGRVTVYGADLNVHTGDFLILKGELRYLVESLERPFAGVAPDDFEAVAFYAPATIVSHAAPSARRFFARLGAYFFAPAVRRPVIHQIADVCVQHQLQHGAVEAQGCGLGIEVGDSVLLSTGPWRVVHIDYTGFPSDQWTATLSPPASATA